MVALNVTSTTWLGVPWNFASGKNVFGPRGLLLPDEQRGEPELNLQYLGSAASRKAITTATDGAILLNAGAVLEWANLTELLVKNEPRYMRQVNFPQAFIGE